MNKNGLSKDQVQRINQIQKDYYARKYDVDYTDANIKDFDLADDYLKLQLKKDVLDAFGLSNKKKADAIWDTAWDLRDDDIKQDVISVMYKLLPIL